MGIATTDLKQLGKTNNGNQLKNNYPQGNCLKIKKELSNPRMLRFKRVKRKRIKIIDTIMEVAFSTDS